MKRYAIIVAGGKGSRMGHSIPKQFLPVNGKPILVYTLEKFLEFDAKLEIVLVLPEHHLEAWVSIKDDHLLFSNIKVVKGGSSRFQSVKNGLDVLPDEGIVAIHDGVRPLVSVPIIEESFQSALEFGSGIASTRLKESVRKIEGVGSVSLNRDDHRLIQTPQTFNIQLIKDAYTIQEKPEYTDDSAVFEAAGNQVMLTEGSYQNIKITTREDIKLMNLILGS